MEKLMKTDAGVVLGNQSFSIRNNLRPVFLVTLFWARKIDVTWHWVSVNSKLGLFLIVSAM